MGLKNNLMLNNENEFHLREGEFILAEGAWSETPWKFVVSKREPDPKLCTAAFCVVVYADQLLLVRNKTRDWEFPGGHINDDEELSSALAREVMEESGAVLENIKPFGHKMVLPKSPIPHRDKPGDFYPFPVSYVPYYFAEAVEILKVNLGQEITDTKLVGVEEAKGILEKGHHDFILQHLIDSKSLKLV